MKNDDFVFSINIQFKFWFYWDFLKKLAFFKKILKNASNFCMTFVKYFAKRAIFCDFRIDSAFYIAEHENAAVLDVYVDFATEGHIGQSSRIAGFEQEFVKRIFEIF